MSHHSPPFDPTGDASLRTGHRLFLRRGSGIALGCAIAFAAACGGSVDESATPTDPEPLIDAVTGDEVAVPSDFSLEFDPSPPGSAAPEPTTGSPVAVDEPAETPAESEPPPAPAGEPGDDAPVREDEHPLEQVVIDTVVSDPEAAPVLDEAASLACANAEFAMDALIESSPDGSDRFATAADWASESTYAPIRAFADQLADAPTGADANDLVIAVLETCAAAGYEL